ncbi:MAG: CPBP family intramembrane metalloprotease [Clostridia bacterium]|nr:CPBP family intramembrane metalloprotease [Clostridia bacterium]
MLSKDTPQASAYRRTMNLMGWSLLIFLGLFSDLNLLDQMLFAELLTGKVGTAISGLISSAVYMAPFIVGGAMFYVFNRKTPTMPIRYGLKLPATTPLLILAGLSMITAAAYVNSWLCTLIGYEIPPEMMAPQGYDDPATVIMYMTTALAPAFAEEFLFRGVIYGNLRPFGKTQAILISSILFALMHQNIGQFFYTFVGGIAMALMYELTGTLWCSILFHLFNNELAVITEVLYYGKYGEAVEPLLMLWDAIVLILGSVAILFLIVYYTRKAKESKTAASPSVFGQRGDTDLSVYDTPVDRETVLYGVRAPGMMVFSIVAFASAILTYLLIAFVDLEAFL